MQTGFRLGRIGPLTIYLNYTWIFATVLIMWWVALVWLPQNFPGWGSGIDWLLATGVMLLFLACVIAHDLIHTAIARGGERNVNLFPFGAAVPFRMQYVEPGRAVVGALASPLFNLLLGGLLLLLSSALAGAAQPFAWLQAIIVPLGQLNLLLGLVNLIPGLPFDGGWALAAGVYFFSNEREGGLNLALRLGQAASIILIVLGAWQGLVSDMWLAALGLVVVGWAAREAGALGRQRSLIRSLLTELKARDFMQPAAVDDMVLESSAVAELVRSHPHFPPSTPLPVTNSAGKLVGISTVGAAEALLQGTWAATPVRAITIPIAQMELVQPDTPLLEVLRLVQTHASTVADEAAPLLPVLDNDRLVGSIDPARLQSFEEAGQQFGVQETLGAATAGRPRGLLGRLATLLPLAIVLVAIAILGNIALHVNADKLQEVITSPESTLQFSNLAPADGDIIGLGAQKISVEVEAASPVTSATISIDGEALASQLAGASPLTQTVTANVPSLTLGTHTARILALTESGERKAHTWQFRVDPRAAQAGATASVAPTQPAATGAPLQLGNYQPPVGARLLAGQGNITVGIDVTATQQPPNAQLILDGQKVSTHIEPVGNGKSVYRVSGVALSLGVGQHRVRVEVSGNGSSTHSSEWTFMALQPDANNVYFKETSHFVSQPFLDYWQNNGGLALFGYPISGFVQETNKATGEVYTAQYFERARFELHPSTGNEVVLGRLGAILKQPEPAAQQQPGAQFFQQTGHNLSGAFLTYWNAHGGLALFGYPITEARMEKNPADGKEYLVQYFERNRFELHPEKAGTPYEVQLGLLGAQLYNRIYNK